VPALAARGVLIGSHDDKTAEDRLRGRALGASVSEFPETRAAAEAARLGGEGVIMGAPNLVRGGSHAGKVAAGDLVAERARGCVGLGLPLPVARTRRVSVGAGRDGFGSGLGACVGGTCAAVGLGDRGRLEPGLRADLVVMEAESHTIVGTISGGAVSYMAGPLAARFLGAGA
jgi:alpha-D-ribose 1-methylphosphonate 5-triphosphate diphosphatase